MATVRRIAVFISMVIAVLLGVLSCTPEASPTPAIPSPSQVTSERTPATVVYVIDGDTIEIARGGRAYRVRYVGIDTPERGQYGYEEATSANA